MNARNMTLEIAVTCAVFGTKQNTSIANDACLRHIINLDIN